MNFTLMAFQIMMKQAIIIHQKNALLIKNKPR